MGGRLAAEYASRPQNCASRSRLRDSYGIGANSNTIGDFTPKYLILCLEIVFLNRICTILSQKQLYLRPNDEIKNQMHIFDSNPQYLIPNSYIRNQTMRFGTKSNNIWSKSFILNPNLSCSVQIHHTLNSNLRYLIQICHIRFKSAISESNLPYLAQV